MGGSAIGVSLRQVGDTSAAPCKEVYDATRALLVKTWRAKLPKKYSGAAIEWVDNGLDSLMTIGTFDNERLEEEDESAPATEVLFYFYDSVDWPLALGHPDDDGVFWQLPEDDFTDYEELDAKTMKLVEASKKKCACPWCATK